MIEVLLVAQLEQEMLERAESAVSALPPRLVIRFELIREQQRRGAGLPPAPLTKRAVSLFPAEKLIHSEGHYYLA